MWHLIPLPNIDNIQVNWTCPFTSKTKYAFFTMLFKRNDLILPNPNQIEWAVQHANLAILTLVS
jgi:hypothetical protein